MDAVLSIETPSPVAMRACTARELMTSNPLSLRDTAPIQEAVAFLIDKGISGNPVIDEAGRPVGVLSQTDILIHHRETASFAPAEPSASARPSRRTGGKAPIAPVDGTLVRDLMTPAVFAAGVSTPASRVIAELCELNVHRLFVVDGNGVLVGVISALDVLRHLNGSRG